MLRQPLAALGLVLALLAVLGAGVALPAPAQAQTDPAALARDAASRLAEAEGLLRAARKADAREVALGRAIRAYEQGLAALRAGLREVSLREAALRADLAARRARVEQLVAALIALSRAPAPALMIHPQGPLGNARAAMIVSEITPALAARAAELRGVLAELERLKRLRGAAIDDLRLALQKLRAARTELAAAIGRRERFTLAPVEQATLEELRRAAASLQDFAAALAARPLDAGAAADTGPWDMPVAGRLLRGFDAPDAAGIRRPGLVIAAAPAALVTAPVAATIRYAGPFPDYGKVIVLEPAPDMLIVLAGLGAVYGEAGQVVARGAPLGQMAGRDPSEVAAAGSGAVEAETGGFATTRLATLYVEVRRSGRPVDPAPLFARNEQ